MAHTEAVRLATIEGLKLATKQIKTLIAQEAIMQASIDLSIAIGIMGQKNISYK